MHAVVRDRTRVAYRQKVKEGKMEENEERVLFETEKNRLIQIGKLDDNEDLQIEEVDDSYSSSSEGFQNENGEAGEYGGSTFDTSPSLSTYLGEVDNAHQRVSFFHGGEILIMPMLYHEGVILFPEATLPLKAIHPSSRAAVERALNKVDAPKAIAVACEPFFLIHHHSLSFSVTETLNGIGVQVRAIVNPEDNTLQFANIGTTAEIRGHQILEDDSFDVLVRGQQRFHLRSHWIDLEGAPCAEVQIMQEELPVRTPKEAFGQLASVIGFPNYRIFHQVSSNLSRSNSDSSHGNNDSEAISCTSFENELSPTELQMHLCAISSDRRYDSTDESTSSDNDQYVCDSRHSSSDGTSRSDSTGMDSRHLSLVGRQYHNPEGLKKRLAAAESKWSYRAPRSYWPHWVFRMYDSYSLCQRAAMMWTQIFRVPGMDHLAKKPELLSFYIASKLPVSESMKQELLEINGISYRLQREIELLECFDLVHCKSCKSVIARRSEMLEMPKDGPLGAHMNCRGFMHEILAFDKADGLTLTANPAEESSWFPGYAWTITICAICEWHIGWLFTATSEKLKPDKFWAVWSFQTVDKIS